jgi:hypothetical protein
MTLTRTLLPVLVLVPAASAADLATLEGRKMTGDIVAINGNELTFKSPAGEEKFLVTTLHSVTTGPAPKLIEAGKKHTTVELIDGSLFRCESIVVKGETIEMKLLGASPRTISIPMRPAAYAINREAGDLKLEQDFRNLVRTRGKFDVWVTKRPVKSDTGKDVDELDGVPGTFGEGDSAAETIKFTFERADAKEKEPTLRMSRVSGMIFNQKAGAAPPALCKVIDLDGNELVAQAVVRADKAYAITTVSGVKFDLSENQISKFDFAAGAIKFLSDLEPVALEESGTDPEHYQRDKNLDKRPIQLLTDPMAGKKETYPKGLTLHAKTMVTYELKGQYKVFRAIVGVDADPETVAPSQVKITIDDSTAGVNLFKGVVKKGDKPLDLNLNVQNVDRLRIMVESDGTVTDLGNQVSLANARVLK